MLAKNDFLLSIIIPVFNERDNIKALIDRLLPVVKNYRYELIFIDDGSIDDTEKEIKKLAKKNSNIKLISFYRNFGHQMALSCGYTESSGDCIVSMDSDLQDPPEIISELISKWQKGAMVVYAKRKAGDTHYTFGKMMNFALDGITSFSLKPLRIATFFGFLAALVGFLGMIYAIIEKIYFPQYIVTGWAAIFVGLMFLGGVQLITIGIIGEYIGKIFTQVRKRPSYTVKEKFNI